MKRMHGGALVCLAIAALLYMLSWTPGFWIVALLGVIFEASAWLLWWWGPDEPVDQPPRR